MAESEIVSGLQSAWSLVKKLGEGDAGEVYLVESLADAKVGILKRPRKSAFTGDMYRQTAQIKTEAKILKSLSTAFKQAAEMRIGVPELLDQAKPGTDYNGQFFIVIEQASGLDLGFLARVTQLGLSGQEGLLEGLCLEDQTFLKSIAKSGKIPNRILITILYRLICLLEQIHANHTNDDEADAWGIVWNDVKPDHLFWDTRRSYLTVIDWGNARFLEPDRTTSDRKFSWADDYRQLYEEMGRFLSVVAPDLQTRLDWPGQFSVENASDQGIAVLKVRLEAAFQQENKAIGEARQREAFLIQSNSDGEDSLTEIEAIHALLLEHGEIPDYAGAARFAAGYAVRLTEADELEELRRLCDWIACLPGADTDQWRLVDNLARIPGRSEGAQRQQFLEAIQSAIGKDWESLLWKMLAAIRDYPEPEWWQDLTALLRRLAFGSEATSLRPLVAVSRLSFSLQAAARRMEDRNSQTGGSTPETTQLLERTQEAARRLREEAIAAWTQLEPGPPDSGLDYTGIDPLLAEVGDILPEEGRSIHALLSHPRDQVKQILEAWDRKDFVAASHGLRLLLLWDPDRRRVLHADRAIQSAPEFLKKVHQGPQQGESFPEWITALEFDGRELRNQVGPAGWLDEILKSCRQIRKGVWPSDLFKSDPAIIREMPWLRRFERVEKLPVLQDEPAPADQPEPSTVFVEIHGIQEGRLGPGGNLALVEPMDAWMPEARGSSARVVLGLLQDADIQLREAAIKLMRMDQVNYSLPLFREEVLILTLMRDIPGIVRLLECGFILLDEGATLPLDSSSGTANATGRVIRIGPDSYKEFMVRIEERIRDGWIPYLAIEKQRQEDSLILLCDAGMTRGQFLPLVTLLQMSIQICEILQVAHERSIVYRDHKILHYYWQAEQNGIYVIDWNVARYHPKGLTPEEIQMDLVQFGARGLHHILTGRTAPGALPLGPTRPEDIDQAAHTYQTKWTYDDQRLSPGLRSILERVLSGEYTSAKALGDDLKRTMIHLPNSRQ
ncbi:MAG TPA: serine/threonine-protein kinase [Anaerolineaceae bacterium]|nr:serine/threonine-protein kinase [Anaerolineaceae bacterium]